MFAARGMFMATPPPEPKIPVTYDATGVGYMGNYNTVRTFSHTATAGAYVVLAFANDRSTFIPSTVQYAGTPMTQLGYAYSSNDSIYGVLALYGLANVPGGARTVSITGVVGGGWAIANTFSYLNVASVNTPLANYGAGTLISSGLVTCNTSEMIVCAAGYGSINLGQTLSNPTGGTNRYITTATYGGSALSVSDSQSSTTFTATPSGSAPWSTMSLILKP